MISNKITRRIYDVIISGKGVTGEGAGYNLAKFTNVRNVLSIEKFDGVATVNSNPKNNAQTSHDGATETNYNLLHALKVQEAAKYLRNYLKSKGVKPELYQKVIRMVLGVGAKEVGQLEERFKIFSPHYPDIFMVNRGWLEELEPMVMKGRDPRQPVCAIASKEGFVVNYQKYAEELFWDTMKLNPDYDYAFNNPG